jgi:hypothetical protein
MRRRYVFIDGGAPTGGGGGGTLQQTVQLDPGDGTWNTPIVSGWFRYCSNDGTVMTNITNSAGSNTGWSLGRPAVAGFSEGPTTATTAGYPSDITHWGYSQATTNVHTFSGLTNSYTYTFDFFGSTTRTWESSAGTTTWTIGGTSVSITHKDYYGDKVTISSVSPTSGTISISISKNASSGNWYMNAMVIKEYN